MKIDGNKTYYSAVILVLFGLFGAPLLGKTATIGNVQAGVEKILMGVSILLAINNASLRHAIAKLEAKLTSIGSSRE